MEMPSIASCKWGIGMVKRLSFFVLPLFMGASALAQGVDTAWVRIYDGPGSSDDKPVAIAVDQSGYIYVTGYSYDNDTFDDYTTLKYQPDGDTVWMRRYNGQGCSNDYPVAVALDALRNVYVTGSSYGDYATVKYDPAGHQLWEARYPGTQVYDWPRAIAVDSAGNVCVTGIGGTVRYDTHGTQLWCDSSDAMAVVFDDSGYVYLCSSGGISKFDTRGIQMWTGLWGGMYLAVDSHNDIYAFGQRYNESSGLDYVIAKYRTNGDTAWVRQYNGPSGVDDRAEAIALDSLDNVYITGTGGTVKYDCLGNQVWSEPQKGITIVLDDSSNVYVAGWYELAKYDKDGKRLWSQFWEGTAIVVDDSSNVYSIDYTYSIDTEKDFVITKCSPKNESVGKEIE